MAAIELLKFSFSLYHREIFLKSFVRLAEARLKLPLIVSDPVYNNSPRMTN